VLVTGASGTGKTTIGRLLRDAGWAVIEADEDRFDGRSIARWVDIRNGRSVCLPVPQPEDWCLTHEWKWRIPVLGEAIAAKEASLVVVCGAASNLDDALFLFDKVFFLVASASTISDRVHSRTDHHFGKQLNEYRQALTQNAQMAKRCEQGLGIRIDATGDIHTVLEHITRAVEGGVVPQIDVRCTCAHIELGGEVTEAQVWDPDCAEHGIASAWWRSDAEMAKQRLQGAWLRVFDALDELRRKDRISLKAANEIIAALNADPDEPASVPSTAPRLKAEGGICLPVVSHAAFTSLERDTRVR